MRKLYRLFGLIVGLIWLAGTTPVRADHIYGGDMQLKPTSTTSVYDLSLILFYDKANLNATNFDTNIDVFVFRKRDNAQIGSFNLEEGSSTPLYGNNAACVKLRDVQLLMVNYTNRVTLPAAQYNDPGGYYVIWERCCRNSALTNIARPNQTGIVMRLDFPPVQIRNSSPVFVVPAPEYVCLNQAFEMDFGASDADGDQLTYELVTPLAGYTTSTNVRGVGAPRSAYPPAQWASGFGLTTAIPGNPALAINASTGKLTVKASQVGLFVFAVVVHERRGGVEIGQSRREYQLPVVDCKLNTPPPANITYNGRDSSVIAPCDNTPITLAITPDTTFGYQWQRNGANITGATSYTLTVTEAGAYTVVKKFLRNCGSDTTSKVVTVLAPNPPDATILATRTVLTSKTDTLHLLTRPQPATFQYRWSTGETKPEIIVNQPGVYVLRVATANNQCPAFDSIRIDRTIRLFTADAFSPNGDGLNDTWEIRNLADLPDCEVVVYDRWGEPVFHSLGYATPWDGTYNAQKVQAGIYRYVIRLPDQTRSGSLQVLY